jgi:hypothetical protein
MTLLFLIDRNSAVTNCFQENLMIPLILVGVGHSKTCNSFIKFAAVAEVSADHGGISRLCVRAGKSPSAQSRIPHYGRASKISTSLRSRSRRAVQDNP